MTISTTAPESGMFHKGEYNTTCDKHNFVLETTITAGNVHDNIAFDALYDKVPERFPLCCTNAPITKKGGHKWYEYICVQKTGAARKPFSAILVRVTLNRRKTSGTRRMEK